MSGGFSNRLITAVGSAGITDDSIMNADINSSAAIDATKLHDGSVSNTELGYISTLSSNAQTQIDAKGAGDLLASNNLSDVSVVATARTNLGVAIGTDVQAYDANNATASSTTTFTNKTYELEDTLASDHTASGTQATMTVDVNTYGVAGALHLDTDGNWIDADADSATTMPCSALALETGTGSKKVLMQGFIRDDTWNWTVGGIIYVSTTAGSLTQTAPSGTGDQVQVVGIATHADRMWFNPDLNLVEIV